MNSTGIERNLDELGRVVIPKEIRKKLNIPEGTPLLISVDGSKIVLEKGSSACSICGSVNDVRDFCGKGVCSACVEQIKAL